MLKNILTSDIETNDSRLIRHLVLLNIFLSVSTFIFLIFIAFNYAVGHHTTAYLNFAGALVSTLLLIDLRYNKKIGRVRNAVIVEFFVFFIAFVYVNQNTSFGLIWSQLFPIVSITLLGLKKGTLLSAIYLGIIFTLAYINIGVWNHGMWDMIAFFRLVFASLTIAAMIVSMEIALEHSYQSLELLSNTDPLTSLYNRRKINEILKEEASKANRYKTPLSLILFDIDDFKKINDYYGHEIGDKVLQALAHKVQSEVRGSDSVARWGGEEFIIVTPMLDKEGALRLAEKLRVTVESMKLEPIQRFTCSFGVATLWECDNSTEHLIANADAAMYDAKSKGKNRVSDVFISNDAEMS